jgi:dipeptidyl aminopeptidase/acylaminoacyl peptidase
MTPISPCPGPDELQRLLDATLPEDDEALLAGHLDGCPACREALDRLAAGGEGRAVAWRPAADRPPLEQALQQAIEALKGETRVLDGPGTPPGEDALPGLLPAADEFGRLGRVGPYEVTEVIGRGGAGVVLKAFDPSLHRFVAIKVLAPHLASSPAARRRFAREGRAAAAVSHEHIVAIHGVDEDNGRPYLVMEYVAGISLQERLDRCGPLELKEVLRIGMQIASGLAAAHAQGLVHRDVKPANILLENGIERVKLTDFGLARAADDARLTQSGAIAGTPQYMAPEQARGEAVDHRADLFSLGSVLYAMCTGRAPFRARTTLGVLRRVSERPPRPVRQVNPEVPEWLAEVIATLHARNPADRFASAEEVRDLLGRCLAHVQQPELGPPPVPPRRRPAARRSRRRWGAAAAVLIAAGVGLLAGAWHLGGYGLPRGASPGAAAMARRVRLRGTLGELHGPVLGVAFSPGSEVLATAGDDGLRLWDPSAAEERRALGEPGTRLWAVAFTSDGKLLAAAGGDWSHPEASGELRVWDATTGRAVRALAKPVPLVFTLAFSPDGKTLASGSWDGVVRLWEADTGRPKGRLAGHAGPVRSVAFAPDGRALASGGYDGSVRLWDLASLKERQCLRAGRGWVNAVAFSPDGRTVASAENAGDALAGVADGEEVRPGLVRLWDAATGRERAALRGARGVVLSVAFSPDGTMLAAGGGSWQKFGEVALWDVASGKEWLVLHGHAEWVECLAFSPDGRTLVSGGGAVGPRGEVKLWDLQAAPAPEAAAPERRKPSRVPPRFPAPGEAGGAALAAPPRPVTRAAR